jgi:hypothetical protein
MAERLGQESVAQPDYSTPAWPTEIQPKFSCMNACWNYTQLIVISVMVTLECRGLLFPVLYLQTTSCHLLCVMYLLLWNYKQEELWGHWIVPAASTSFSMSTNRYQPLITFLWDKKTTVVNYIQQNPDIMLCRSHLKMVTHLAKCKILKMKFMHSNKMLVAGQQKASVNHAK